MDNKERLGQNIFIVLEGLSGSGKTTVGKLVAKKMGAKFYKTPPPLFETIRNRVDQEADLTARFLFYLAGVIQASTEISHFLELNSVVCDRYSLTTICYHRALGVTIDIPDLISDSLIKPTHTFLITCEEVKRISRLEKRGLSYNDIQERHPNIEQRFLSEYRKHRLIEVDNSSDDPAIAADVILHFC